MQDRTMSLKNAWDMMQNKGIVTLPICNSDDELEGIVTIGDIADIYSRTRPNVGINLVNLALEEQRQHAIAQAIHYKEALR